MKRKIGRKVTIGSLLVGVAMASTVAFAAWTAGGTGDGYAQAKTAVNLTTSAATLSATLYPGGTGDAYVNITNPNPYPVKVTTVAANGAITASGTCTASSVTFTAPGAGTLAWVIAAGATTQFTMSNSVAMASSAPDTCQGATFTIPVTLSGTSN
jgi:hypothetical protein